MDEIKYVDNHAHLNFSAFDGDREEVILRAEEASVAVINVGTQKETSKKAVEIAESADNCYAIVGLHPIHTSKSFHDQEELGEGGKAFTSKGEEFDYKYYKNLALHSKVVGIGECGLDKYRSGEWQVNSGKQQIKAFENQIRLSLEVKKPLMLHIREAYAEALEILTTHYSLTTNHFPRGNAHFFAGTVEEAQKFLDLGFTLSFTGVITFAKQYEELVRYVPLDMMLSETDCPYVSPVPYRGKRNEPVYVIEVVKKIAEIKNLALDEVQNTLLENSKRVFGI